MSDILHILGAFKKNKEAFLINFNHPYDISNNSHL